MNEEISIRFGSDLSGLAAGLRGMKGMVQSAAESTKEAFKSLFAPLSIAGAVEAGRELVRSMLEDVKNIKRISESTGLNTGMVQDFLNLGKAAGISGDAIESAMDKFVKGLAPGSGPEDELMKLADRFAELKDPVERSQLAFEEFGKSGAKMIPILMQGSEGVKKLAEEWGKLDEVQMAQIEHANQTLEKTESKSKVWLASLIEGASNVPSKMNSLPIWKRLLLGPAALIEAARQAGNDTDLSKDQPDTVSSPAKKTPAELNRAKIEAATAAAKKISEQEAYLYAKPEEKVLMLTRQILEIRRQIEDTNDADEQLKLGEKMVSLEGQRKSIQEQITKQTKERAEKEKELAEQIAKKQIELTQFQSTIADRNAQYGTLQEIASAGFSFFQGNRWQWRSSPLAADAQRVMFLESRAHNERIWGNKFGAEQDESLADKLREGLEQAGALTPQDHLKVIKEKTIVMEKNIADLTAKLSELKKSTE